VHLFSEAAAKSRTGWQPQLPLELAFVEATLHPAAPVAAETPTKKAQATKERKRAQHTSRRRTTRSEKKQTEKAPAPQSAEREAATGDAISVEEIKNRWKELLHQLSPPIAAPLWSAKPLGKDSDGALVLGFRHSFHRNKAQEEAYRHLENLLSKTLNQSVRVRCVLEEEWSSPTQSRRPTPSPATEKPANKPAPQSQAEEETNAVEEDEVIQRAVKELGAVPTEVTKDE
jgi:hypothetical protein